MKYCSLLLEHFFSPRNIGSFAEDQLNIGRVVLGTYENGSVIHFQVQIDRQVVVASKFKAYGPPPIIAACSYATDFLENKKIEEALTINSGMIMEALELPDLKMYVALLVEDAVKGAIKNSLSY